MLYVRKADCTFADDVHLSLRWSRRVPLQKCWLLQMHAMPTIGGEKQTVVADYLGYMTLTMPHHIICVFPAGARSTNWG